MLTDAELQAIADNYVLQEQVAAVGRPNSYQLPWVGLRVCRLDTPPGVYFVPEDPSALLAMQGEPAVEWSRHGELAGFFIYRTNGEMRIITEAEEMSVKRIRNVPMRYYWEGTRYMLTAVLTGSEPDIKPAPPPHLWNLDYHLQDTADEYVRRELPDFVAVWQFELDDPPGVYFTPRHHDWMGKPYDAMAYVSEPGVLGTAGFFVHRTSGEVRIFSSGEWVAAESSLGLVPGTPLEDSARIVRQILTGTRSVPPPRRPWWRFW